MKEYSRLHVPKIDARHLAIMPAGDAFVMRSSSKEQEKSSLVVSTDGDNGKEDATRLFTRMRLLWTSFSYDAMKSLNTKGQLSSLMTQLRSNAVLSEGVSLN